MEKINQPTPLRPEGQRVLSAPTVEMDLHKFIAQIKSEETWKDSQHNSITIYKTDALRIVLIGMHEGSELRDHATKAVISAQVLQGEIKFGVGEDSYHLSEGQMIALQPKIEHNVKALKESFFLLTLSKVN